MYKICLLGPKSSGKTCIALRMVCDVFNEDYSPSSSVGYLGTSLQAKEQGVSLRLWDTEGQEGLDSRDSDISVGGSQVVLIVYDCGTQKDKKDLTVVIVISLWEAAR